MIEATTYEKMAKISKGYYYSKLNTCLIGLTVLLSCSMSLYAKSALLSENLLKDQHLESANGKLERLSSGGYKLTVPNKVKECKINIPVAISDWTIYNTLELGISSLNNNTTIIVEAFEPSHSHFLKKIFKLNSQKSVYSIKIPYRMTASKINSLRLSFYNKQDNSHIPYSTIEHPIEINYIRLITYGSVLRKTEVLGKKIFKKCDYSSLGKAAKQVANRKRSQLQKEFYTLLDKLKLKNQTAISKRHLLLQLHRLKNKIQWTIESEALKVACAKRQVIYASCGGADKIFRQKPFPGHFNSNAEIKLAKNETEACQIALFSTKTIDKISVSCDGLVNDKGNRINSKQIEIVPVGYVNTTKPRYYVDYYGWTPDPLLTYLKEFNLEANNYQPVWIDVTTTFDQAPGIYCGKIDFYTNKKKLVSVPLKVKVWNFCLPGKMSFPTAISCNLNGGDRFKQFYSQNPQILKEYSDFIYSGKKHIENLSAEARSLVAIHKQTAAMLEKHHIPENYIYRNMNKNPVPAWQRKKFKKNKTNFCIGYSGGSSVKQTLKMIAPQIDAMKKDGSYKFAYIYGYDEISRKTQFDRMRRVWGAVKKTYPDIPLMATALDYSYGEKTNTKDIVDIWVAPTPNYILSRAAAKRARARGKKVWWYTCNWPFPPYANFLIDTSATSHRLLVGFMPWKFKVDGYLYYAIASWRSGIIDDNQLGAWKMFGDSRIQSIGASGHDSVIKVTTTKKRPLAGVWQWKKFRQQFPKPINVSVESCVKKLSDGKPEDYVLFFNVKYCDGTKDNLVYPFDANVKGWQKIKFSFVPKKAVKIFVMRMQINNRMGTVLFRNPSVSQEGVQFTRNKYWRKPIAGGPLTNHNGRGFTMHNGDGFLIYPAIDRTIPTIRLKCLRDGLEDYEYLVMLRNAYKAVKAGKTKPANRDQWLAKAEKCLQVDNTLVEGLASYTQNGSILLEYRRKIGDLLNNLPK